VKALYGKKGGYDEVKGKGIQKRVVEPSGGGSGKGCLSIEMGEGRGESE